MQELNKPRAYHQLWQSAEFEASKQDLMSCDTIGKKIVDQGNSDGEGDKMLLFDCNTSQLIEEMIKSYITEVDVDTYNIGAIPGSPKNWEPLHLCQTLVIYVENARIF